MKNALGNKIEIGRIYGHSTRTSGFVTVMIGEANAINENGVELRVIKRGQSTYGNDIKETKIGKSIITVLGNSLFPVDSEDVENLKWLAKETQVDSKFTSRVS